MNSHKIKEKWILLTTGRAANHFKFRARIYRKLAIFDSVFTQYFIFTRFIFFNTFFVGDLHFPALSIDTNNGNIRGHIESGHNCQKSKMAIMEWLDMAATGTGKQPQMNWALTSLE